MIAKHRPDMSVGYGDIGFFISDSKTRACWLAVRSKGAISALAPAPPEARQ